MALKLFFWDVLYIFFFHNVFTRTCFHILFSRTSFHKLSLLELYFIYIHSFHLAFKVFCLKLMCDIRSCTAYDRHLGIYLKQIGQISMTWPKVWNVLTWTYIFGCITFALAWLKCGHIHDLFFWQISFTGLNCMTFFDVDL